MICAVLGCAENAVLQCKQGGSLPLFIDSARMHACRCAGVGAAGELCFLHRCDLRAAQGTIPFHYMITSSLAAGCASLEPLCCAPPALLASKTLWAPASMHFFLPGRP